MRRPFLRLTIIVFASVLLSSVAAFSADATDLSRQKAGAASPTSTRIETDQKTGAIRFIIKGREEARVDATGLHVRQHVAYGGSIIDVGQEGYSDRALPAAGDGKP